MACRSASAGCERPRDYLDLAVGRVLTAASFRRSVWTANNTPIAISARVAPKLAGAMQVRQVPTISGAAYMAVFFVFAIHRWLPVLRESIHHFEVNDEPRAVEAARRHSRKTRLRCTAQSFLLVRTWNISRMAVINQSTMYGWDMSAIQIMGFGLAIIWAASFVFLGYLLLPRRSELDQSN
jgi:hypothetical protein